MSAKVFVTGANGFIGGHLVTKLLARGYQVTCLVRDPLKAGALQAAGATLVKGDIADRESLRAGMAGAEAVFHLAGWYALGVRDKGRMYAVNVRGAQNTLQLAAQLGIPKILHTSTVAVFGNTHGKVVDESYHIPKEALSSEYEKTKWQAHYEVALPLQRQGAPLIILQPSGVTGAGDRSPHVQALKMFLQRTPVMMGAQSGMCLAHVDDIAEGHILALEKGQAGEAYILAGEPLTFRQIFELCEQITGMRAARLWAPGWAAGILAGLLAMMEKLGVHSVFSSESLAAMNDYTYWASSQKAVRQLGWNPRPTLETLKDILADLQKQ